MTIHSKLRLSAAVIALMVPGTAWANCDLTQPDVICDGATGANTTATITGKRSVRFQNSETQAATTGLTVNGDATNGANVTIDAGSSINASQAASLGPGQALIAYTALTLRGGGNGATARINGDLISASSYGLDASTTTSTGLIDVAQGATSTIRGASYSLGGLNYGFNAIRTQAIGGADTRITTNGTLVGGINASSGNPNTIDDTSAGASAFQITNNGSILDLSNGLGGIAITQRGTGDVSVVNNGSILTTSFGINANVYTPTGVTRNAATTITVNGNIGSAASRPRIAAIVQVSGGTNTGDIRIGLNSASIFGGLIATGDTRGNVSIIGTGTGLISDNSFGPNLTAATVIAANTLKKGPGNVTIDLTQTIGVDLRNYNTATLGTASIDAATSGSGAVSVNRTSGGGNITVANGNAIDLLINSGVGISTAVGSFVPLSAAEQATRLDNNTATLAVTVGAGKTVSAAQGTGIRLFSGYSTGAATADINGTISAGNAGVWGRGTRNDFTVTVATTGSIAGATGIDLTTAADYSDPNSDFSTGAIVQLNITPTVAGLQLAGVLTANNAGTVSGTTTGIRLIAGGTGTAVVTNTGTLTGGTNAVAGSTAGTAFRITNGATGTMTGGINVTGSSVSASLFTNSGRWNVGSGNSSFSGALANTGIINAADGVAGNNSITITGNYTGGGQIFLDASTATARADTLTITGTATGTTAVTVNRLAQGRIAGGFLPLITVTGGAAAGAFTSTSFADAGVFRESFGVSKTNANQFGILQAFNPLLTGLGGLHVTAATAAAALDDSVLPYVTGREGAASGKPHLGLWIRGTSGSLGQTLATVISDSTTQLASATNRLELDHRSIQGGADLGWSDLGGRGWSVHLGIMGGTYSADATQPATRIKVNVPFLGAYAALTGDRLTIEANVRREWRRFDVTNAVLFGTAAATRTKGRAWAGAVAASYRLPLGHGFALTPRAALSWSNSRIDTFAIDNFTRLAPGSDNNSVARLGARLSWAGKVGSGLFAEPYAGAYWVKNMSNSETATILSADAAGTVIGYNLNTTGYRSTGQYVAGLSLRDERGHLSGFIEGRLDRGNSVRGHAISGGVRVQF